MNKKSLYISKTEEYVKDLLKGTDIELVDVEFVHELNDYYLRVYIDKKDGVSIGDCTDLSRKMNEILDREDYVKEQYIFEVCSSGDRPFKKESDYKRNLENKVEVKTYRSIDKSKEFVGILKEYTGDTITLEDEGKDIIIDLKNISLIRKAF
jgi:hypothetical protein